jgi:uncharacterized protein YsxB (DUF464 family)
LVEATFYATERGFTGCTIDGHAEYNRGNDIVCSAISALGMALVGALKAVKDLDLVRCEYRGGNIRIESRLFIEDADQAPVDAIYRTVFIGLKQVERSYPKYVQVKLI